MECEGGPFQLVQWLKDVPSDLGFFCFVTKGCLSSRHYILKCDLNRKEEARNKRLSSHASYLLLRQENLSPKSPSHLPLPSHWPRLDHMAIASCRGGCKSKHLEFSVSIVGSWQRKGGLRTALGSYPIMPCFGNFALMKRRPCFKICYCQLQTQLSGSGLRSFQQNSDSQLSSFHPYYL